MHGYRHVKYTLHIFVYRIFILCVHVYMIYIYIFAYIHMAVSLSEGSAPQSEEGIWSGLYLSHLGCPVHKAFFSKSRVVDSVPLNACASRSVSRVWMFSSILRVELTANSFIFRIVNNSLPTHLVCVTFASTSSTLLLSIRQRWELYWFVWYLFSHVCECKVWIGRSICFHWDPVQLVPHPTQTCRWTELS